MLFFKFIIKDMEKLNSYIREVLGTDIIREPVTNKEAEKLPFYIKESFRLFHGNLLGQQIILAAIENEQQPTTLQLDKQLEQLKNVFSRKVVLIIERLTAIDRNRLIKKGINFIVPGTQLYLPDLLIDLRETYTKRKPKKDKLLPSAQFILLYKILHRKEPIEEWTFKQLAEKFRYTQTAIGKAIENLKSFDLCTTEGSKEKYIRFNREIKELWRKALPMLTSPVLKTVYSDKLPDETFLLQSNASALAEYSDMSASRQAYRAIEKGLFQLLKKHSQWRHLNEHEGQYCIEVWKYNPLVLATGITHDNNVDPLSLYLSMKDNTDARIEMAMEQIIKKYIW